MVIKPDAVKGRVIGEILTMVEKAGLKITGLVMRTLSRKEAERFYRIHRGKNFFAGLVEFISSGPVVAVRVEGEDARSRLRKLTGATDPKKADKGTIRRRFGSSVRRNAVHCANPQEDVDQELRFFFRDRENK